MKLQANFEEHLRTTAFFNRIVSGAYSEPYQKSKMELFANIVNDEKPLAVFTKSAPFQMFSKALNKSSSLKEIHALTLTI